MEVKLRTAARPLWIPLALLAFAVISAPVYAQGSASPQPTGGQGGAGADGQHLNLQGAAFGSYSNNVMADFARDLPGAVGGRNPESSFYSGLTGGMNYGYTKQGATFFSFDARSTASYYPEYDIRSTQHTADVTFSRPLGRRTTFNFSQNARASDTYRLELFPDLMEDDPHALRPLDDQYAMAAIRTYSYVTSTGLSRTISRRATIGANYRLRYVDSPNEAFNFMVHDAGATFQYQLTKYGNLRAGYQYREAPRYSGASAATQDENPFKSHGVNLGIDYNRAFSVSGRRTSLTFSTGSALLASAREEEDRGEERTSAQLRPVLQGTVTLRRNLGRTWDAQASYRRLVHFIEGFTDPLFTESVSAGVGGQVGRYFRADAAMAHAFGGVGRGKTTGKSYGSKSISAQFARPLTNQLSVFSEYLYLRQHLGEDIVLPAGLAHSLNRHSVRVGLSLGLGLID